MTGYLQRLLVRLGADIRGYQRNMLKAHRIADRWGSNMIELGNRMTMALSVPMAAVAGYAIRLGMDAIESENLFSVSMGRMEGAARSFSEQLREELKLNAYEVRRNVGVLYNMLTSMGLTEQEAYRMSTAMTQLNYDMASFYNLPTEEAFNKLRSGITGETEPLKQLGILVDENTVKQVALANGIARTGEKLTQQQKVQARYIAIMQQTSKAQGDLARTIDQPANRLRALRQQTEQTAIELGMALMPVVEDLLPVVEDAADAIKVAVAAFRQLDPATRRNVIQITALIAAAGPLTRVLGSGVTAAGKLAGMLARTATEAGKLQGGLTGATNAAVKTSSASRSVQQGLAAANGSSMALNANLVVLAATMGWMVGKAIRPYVEELLGLDDAQYKVADAHADWIEQLTESEETYRQNLDLYNRMRDELGLVGEEWRISAERCEENAGKLARNTEKVRALARAQVELKQSQQQANQSVISQAEALGMVNAALAKHAKHVAKVNEKYGLMTQQDVSEYLQKIAKDFEDARSSGVHMNQLIDAFGDNLEEQLGKAKDYKMQLDELPEPVQQMTRALAKGGHEGVAELAKELAKIPGHVDTTGGKVIEGITWSGKEAGKNLHAELKDGIFEGARAGVKQAQAELAKLEGIEIPVKVKPIVDPADLQREIRDARNGPDVSGW